MPTRSLLACSLLLLSSSGAALRAQTASVSLYAAPAAAIGSALPFQITGPPNTAYVFDVSLAGSSPGTPLGPGLPTVPLNRPFVFLEVFGGSPAFSSVFQSFLGVTDAQGRATPVLRVPATLSLVGLSIDAAAVAAHPSTPGALLASNAVRVTLVSSHAEVGAGAIAPFPVTPPPGAATRFVSPAGSDANNGLTPATAWRQVSHAASVVGPGTIVDIADGSYAGPVLIRNKAGSAAAPIVFRATGANAVLTGSANSNNDDRNSIFIGSSSWVTIHGLKVFSSLRAGVRVSLSDHVTIQACVFGNHQKWGVFTDYADDLRVLGCECYGSIDEHGIYHSNSSDRGVLVGNWCHDNQASGIQINADPAFLSPIGGYVPDGISFACLVERNFLQNNGVSGGGSINLASVRRCVIRDNVIVTTQINSTGVAMWDDGNGAQWGSKDNLVEHNTVAFPSGAGRYAIGFSNGSTGNVIRDNVLRGGRRGSIAFSQDSLGGLVANGNVFFSVDTWPIIVRDDSVYQPYTLAQWQALGFDAHSVHAAPLFANPAALDWSLAPGSPGRDGGVWSAHVRDHQGSPRPQGAGFDAGAYER